MFPRALALALLCVSATAGAADYVALDTGISTNAQFIGSSFGVTPSLELDPTLGVYAHSGRFTAFVTLSPRIQINSFTLSSCRNVAATPSVCSGKNEVEKWINLNVPQDLFFNRGRAQMEEQLSREAKVFVYGAGDYGTQVFVTATALQANLTNAPVTLPPTVNTLPKVATATVRDTSTGGGLDWAMGTHVRLFLTGNYGQGGGADSVSRLAVPYQNEEDGQVFMGIIASREDLVATTLYATHATFDRGPYSPIPPQSVELEQGIETWRRLLGKESTGQLGLGVARAVVAGQVGRANELLPIVQLSGQARFHGTGLLNASLNLELAPYVDRLLGVVYERAAQSLTLSWRFVRDWMLTGALLGGESVYAGSQHGIITATLQGALEYTLVKDVKVQFGAYGSYQHLPPLAPALIPPTTGNLPIGLQSGPLSAGTSNGRFGYANGASSFFSYVGTVSLVITHREVL